MSNTQRNRVPAQVLEEDILAYRAMLALPDYKPFNPAFSAEALTRGLENMTQCDIANVHAQNAAAATQDSSTKGTWGFHELVLGMKTQVRAQYGEDSDQLASLGLKKKSERKARGKGKKTDNKP